MTGRLLQLLRNSGQKCAVAVLGTVALASSAGMVYFLTHPCVCEAVDATAAAVRPVAVAEIALGIPAGYLAYRAVSRAAKFAAAKVAAVAAAGFAMGDVPGVSRLLCPHVAREEEEIVVCDGRLNLRDLFQSFLACVVAATELSAPTEVTSAQFGAEEEEEELLQLTSEPVTAAGGDKASAASKRDTFERMTELNKRKQNLERKLRTEAKFYALQDRLRELLCRDRALTTDVVCMDNREAAPEPPPLPQATACKSRSTMLKIHERLVEIEDELTKCQVKMEC